MKLTTTAAAFAIAVTLSACSVSGKVPMTGSTPPPNAMASSPATPAPPRVHTTTSGSVRLTCQMVHGTQAGDTANNVPTLTPKITVTNISGSPLNLLQYLGTSPEFSIWYLNAAGGTVSVDSNDTNMASPYMMNTTLDLNPGQSWVFSAQYINNQVFDSSQDPVNQGVTGCRAKFAFG